ncbi:hypothetical protein PG994_011501 [Apiospora phragmitis]|uniref:Cytidyltransferase-like domain-containing protein n=1 Tax=Apiospora phragmitis TaxID=2905665 RepID=A0ABR1TSZ8_9PEZI
MDGSRSATADVAPYLEIFRKAEAGQGREPHPDYTGTFNPPHAGHLATLKHVFDHYGKDYNVVAVVVEMTHDRSLQRKFRRRPTADTLLLSSTQRLQIWEEALQNHEGKNDWCWIIGGYNFCEVDDGFKDMVLASTTLSGFEVRITQLQGGDHICPRFASSFWDDGDFIIPNISRPVEFEDDLGGMTALPGCIQWERIPDQEEPDNQGKEALV